MSTHADNPEHAPSTGSSSKKGASGWVVFAFFVVGFIVSVFGGWIGFPNLLYSEKQQPIDFSHALHNDLVYEGCESCHYFRDDGSFAGVPDNSACADCHMYVQGTDPNEEKFVTEYIDQNKEVPWHIYSKQPICVFFSHAAHVKGANMDCATCHGDIGQSESLKPYQENRITGYSRDIWGYDISRLTPPKPGEGMRMKMNDCAACHLEETGSKGDCFQCHK